MRRQESYSSLHRLVHGRHLISVMGKILLTEGDNHKHCGHMNGLFSQYLLQYPCFLNWKSVCDKYERTI